MNDEKKFCIVESGQGQYVWNMMLSDEQINVFKFLMIKGLDFNITVMDEPIEV